MEKKKVCVNSVFQKCNFQDSKFTRVIDILLYLLVKKITTRDYFV